MSTSISTETPGPIREPTLAHLRNAKWYAFDLDDTLHSFRAAAASATNAVLLAIHNTSALPLAELEAEYKHILTRGTTSAFVDGRTSHQYRAARFQQLAHAFSIEIDNAQMNRLVKRYEKVLTENLQLKPGVVELLKTLKRYGHKIAVVTEGPQDAQERTVKALGLVSFVDFLATTNKLGVSKVDGLFGRVLEHLGVGSGELIVVGDSWERDVVPARQAGMYCFHYSENEPENLEANGWRSIRGLEELRVLVETAHSGLKA